MKVNIPIHIQQNLSDHHNKVAVLPFGYIKDMETSNFFVVEQIQQETFAIFSGHSGYLQFQDPITTNALLAKAGVKNNNLTGFTMGEICDILGVEYTIQGTVTLNEESQTTTTNSSFNRKTSSQKEDSNKERHGHLVSDIWNRKDSGSSNTINYSTKSYSTNFLMNVYKDNGQSIFSKSHESFWSTDDAYKITLKWLAKRTPLFTK